MNEERDLVVKRIIPKLRRLCLERDIVLSCVDLRWGVTEAQTQGAATLLMCLREIEKCNIFIGLYGERYGWCLTENSYRKPTQQDELLVRTFALAAKEFPWVNQYKDRSVTEVEMRMVFQKHSRDPNKNGSFYFRDPYYVESVNASQRQDFLSEGEFEKAKLDTLKEDIRKSPYAAVNYNRPTHLGEILFEDLKEVINKKYPAGTELNPFKRERFLHSTFSRSLTRVYLPHENWYMSLDRYASSNTVTPLVVSGEMGVGKSALLANWAKRYREHHPEVVVVEHWIGCTGKSSNHSFILRRIMDEIQDHLNDTTDDIPKDTKEMEKIFPSWLERTLSRNRVGKIVVIIDGLDNLEENNNSHTLLWLPQRFPPSVRLVLSVAPSRPMEMLKKRNYETLEITYIEQAERASFIRQYLNMNSKKLSEAQEHKIARCKQTGNPRYLKVLLEDISMWGQFEQLDKRIDNDLKATDTSQLYEIVLERLEKDYDKDGKEMVKPFMSYVWASRRGLVVDTELAYLLEKEKIDFNSWQTLFLGVEDLFLSSGGLLNFVNRDIRRAVQQRYLKDPNVTKKYHATLAEYFDKNIEGLTDRKVDELAHQLFHAEDWPKLQAVLLNLGMFNKLYIHHKFDLLKYWRSLESRYDIVESYVGSIERGDSLPADVLQGDLFYQVGRFLSDMAKFDGATKVLVKARNVYNVSSQNLAVAKTDLFLATIQLSQAKYKDAEELLNKCLALYIRERGEEDIAVATVYRKLGDLHLSLNSYDKAEDCFQKALRITKSKLGTTHWKVAKILTLMTNFYARTGKYEQGIECGNQALKIGEEEFGPDDGTLIPILAAIGRITMSQQKYDESKAIFKRALKIGEEKFGKDHPKTADILYELGAFFFVKPEELSRVQNKSVAEKFKQRGYWENQDYSKVAIIKGGGEEKENKKGWSMDRAEKLFLQSLTIFENAYGLDHPDVARVTTRLGSLYIERVQYLKAEEYLQRSLAIYTKAFGKFHSRVAQTYKHLFTLYNLQEKLEESKNCGKEALAVLIRMRGEESIEVANIYERLGDQCGQANRKEEAKEYLLKAKAIRVALLGASHKDVAAVDLLLNSLVAPPPPPPPPVCTKTTEELLQEANVDITSEMKAQRGRNDLLDAIKNFGMMKEQLSSAESAKKKQKKQANEEERKGWWRQNYQAGFDAKAVPKPMPQKVLDSIARKPQVASKVPPPPPPPSF
uniref:NACHT domain-containing protein n=1 Tax=Arcella intermedia TaxID=1963864 RepID=A0A6B2KWC3_9EUKA